MAAKTLYLDFVFDAPIERVFHAFTDMHAIAKWLPPYGYIAEVIQLDAETGGKFDVILRDFKAQKSFRVRGDYLAVVPNHFICYTEQFLTGEGEPIGDIHEQTISFSSDYNGTEVKMHQTTLTERIQRDDLYLNWQESFSLLELLVND